MMIDRPWQACIQGLAHMGWKPTWCISPSSSIGGIPQLLSYTVAYCLCALLWLAEHRWGFQVTCPCCVPCQSVYHTASWEQDLRRCEQEIKVTPSLCHHVNLTSILSKVLCIYPGAPMVMDNNTVGLISLGLWSAATNSSPSVRSCLTTPLTNGGESG